VLIDMVGRNIVPSGNLEKDLFEAIRTGLTDQAAVRLIQDHNANNLNINAISTERESRGKTLLYYASEMGRLEIIEALLAVGADINMAISNGKTPLSIACQENKPEVVRILLQARPPPEVNAKDKTGKTALIEAALSGSVECVRLLLQANPPADPHIKVNPCNTALTYANTMIRPRKIDLEVLLWEAMDPRRIPDNSGSSQNATGAQSVGAPSVGAPPSVAAAPRRNPPRTARRFGGYRKTRRNKYRK